MLLKELCIVGSLLVVVCLGAPQYTTQYDDIDLDEVIQSERLLKNYINCLEDKGPCTPDAKQLKELLPDALATECSKCSEKQKAGAEKVVNHLIDNNADDWARLEKIYDPSGQYREKYLKDRN